ncbi:winged helix-turn-helix transcriptional regulator [Clostridium beijerinckii]|uniref:winged helix-turn-helix transcriptional regulator n=1 Tax=Clostridium beijerinckii TaxID=1520 RepID=UPI0003107A0F|nr:helix-turn-helix domain-containing protein [Clostridium beijerinckii]
MASKQELEKYLNIVKESDFNENCPIKDALEVIGGKWKLNILGQLLRKDVCRFNQLKREVSGITNTMLANSLRELENDKLITRNQYNEMPVRVEYTLTDKGRNLLPLLYELTIWWEDYIKNKEISK